MRFALTTLIMLILAVAGLSESANGKLRATEHVCRTRFLWKIGVGWWTFVRIPLVVSHRRRGRANFFSACLKSR